MRIIFLDIDGPMIPAVFYLQNSNPSYTQELDPRSVAVIKFICEKSRAKIVFNTTHNRYLHAQDHSPGLIRRFEDAGLGEYLFYEDICTSYPDMSRAKAIGEWLSRHADAEWVALDDCKIDHPRACLVDGQVGIGFAEIDFCAGVFGFERPIILL